MKRVLAAAIIFALFFVIQPSSPAADSTACRERDAVCKAFAKLAAAEQHEQIIAKIDPKRAYSDETRKIIGQAYLMVAGKEGNTPEQEEQFCLKALEYGATSAYMGLYFIHAGTNGKKALGYLEEYVATKPKDSVPYVILGETALENKNYPAANAYLVEAHKVARGKSANLDWLLFQASYLNGDFSTSARMLDNSFSHGKTIGDLKALIASDSRFQDLKKHPEFRKFLSIVNGTAMARAQDRP